jgi:hypothetical protein
MTGTVFINVYPVRQDPIIPMFRKVGYVLGKVLHIHDWSRIVHPCGVLGVILANPVSDTMGLSIRWGLIGKRNVWVTQVGCVAESVFREL